MTSHDRRGWSHAVGDVIAARPELLRIALAVAVLALGACSGEPRTPPTTTATEWLSITSPTAGSTMSGTVALAASGVGGKAHSLTFALGSQRAEAAPDGTATLDTRGLAAGVHALEATAMVNGREVRDAIDVVVDNDLPQASTVGTAGGALRSTGGSYATILPNALAAEAGVSVRDTTQQEILDAFGIDYPALGVTFLGSLTVDADVERFERPLAVDLAGWSQGVQPGQQVVMFTIASDASGDGVGELMFAANAQATPDGSVITRPVPRAEIYGFGDGTTAGLSDTVTARPGTIVTLSGRGFNANAHLSNVVRFTARPDLLVVATAVEDVPFNPLLRLQFAVPAIGTGAHALALHNLTTGDATAPLSLGVAGTGTGSATAYGAFVAQVRIATARLTVARPDLAAAATAWLAQLEGSNSPTAAAMTQNSGLVSADALALLDGVTQGALTETQLTLIHHHALLLDALALSVPELAPAAGDLATLLVVTTPAATSSATGLTRLSGHGGATCSGAPSATIVIGNPTGMGSAQPGSCSGGSTSDSGGGGPSASRSADVMRQNLRSAAFAPTAGALVAVFKRGTLERLTPFSTLTDHAGYWFVPFIPPGEPFTIRAVDPATGRTASADGVAGDVNEFVSAHLVFGPGSTEGGPTADFTIAPVAGGPPEGSWRYEFDAGASASPSGERLTYSWDFGGFVADVDTEVAVRRGYGRNGTYQVRLTVTDEQFRAASATRHLVIDDLPYDYWGVPPDRVDITADGEAADRQVLYGHAISADGRFVTFTSAATNLVAGDVTGTHLYLKDMETGEIERVSRGTGGIHGSDDVAMSDDGRFVVFTEVQTLTTNRRVQIRDRVADTLTAVLADDPYVHTTLLGSSGAGGVVAFRDHRAGGGSYVKDLDTGAIVRLGLRLDGEYAEHLTFSSLSADGRFVVFESFDANLVAGDTNERTDVFVTDLETGVTVLASTTADGRQGDRESRAWGQRAISADGRYVTFWSSATAFGAHADGFTDHIYVKDLVTGSLELVSANAAGAPADDDSVLAVISGDGRYVAFGSYAGNLAPAMDMGSCSLRMCTSGFTYVKDRQTGRVALVSVGLNDSVPDDGDQIEPIISADGRYIGYYSWATNLVDGVSPTTSINRYYRALNPLWVP